MTESEGSEFIRLLTDQVSLLTAQANTNCANIAALTTASANLKDVTERLWNSADAQRLREADCRRQVDKELDVLRDDMNGAINSIRDSLSNVKYVAGALAVVGGILGTVIGFLLQ